ncbi:MAG: ThuA domain-containing protein [Verrucomicrobia bacterium]|nr:ThuA domain-containing protein [Verrucomicrobiota bacterium]
MKLTVLLALAFALGTSTTARAADHLVFEGKNGPGKGLHIVLMAGDEEYRSEEAMPMLAKILSERHGFRCTVCFSLNADGTINPDNQTGLSYPEALDSADAIIMSIRFRQYPDDVRKHFTDALARGVPIIGLRTSTHAFKDKDLGKFGKEVLGEQWVNHWGSHKHEATRGIIEASAKDEAILNGVSDIFGTTDVYEAYPAADAKILLRGQVLKGMNPTDEPADYKKKRSTDKQEQGINDPMMPIAWTREMKIDGGKTRRTLCTTMGAASDLTNEGLRRLVVNGVFWSLGLEVPKKADVSFVDPYEPTFYSAGAYNHGKKPEDFALGKATTPAPTAPPKMKK